MCESGLSAALLLWADKLVRCLSPMIPRIRQNHNQPASSIVRTIVRSSVRFVPGVASGGLPNSLYVARSLSFKRGALRVSGRGAKLRDSLRSQQLLGRRNRDIGALGKKHLCAVLGGKCVIFHAT